MSKASSSPESSPEMRFSRTRHIIKFTVGLALIVIAGILYQDRAQRDMAQVIAILGFVFAALHGIMLLIKR